MITLVLLTTTEMASYEDVKYFFWVMSILIPLLYVLYVKGVPDQLSKKKREERALYYSFLSYV